MTTTKADPAKTDKTGLNRRIPRSLRWLRRRGLPDGRPYVLVYDHGNLRRFPSTVAVGLEYGRSATTVRKAIRTGCELVEGVTVDWEDLT